MRKLRLNDNRRFFGICCVPRVFPEADIEVFPTLQWRSWGTVYLGHPGRSWGRTFIWVQVSWFPTQGSPITHPDWAPPSPRKGIPPGRVLSPASLAPLAWEAWPSSPARQPGCPTRGQEPSLAAFGGRPSRAALSCAEFSTQHGFIIQVCPARQASAAGRRGTWRPERAWR